MGKIQHQKDAVKNLHADHRSRMKARFRKEGFENMRQHEMLEMLLYYSIPRKDTNEIAHTLIAKYGSLSGVFDAPISSLCEVKGISEHSATLIKMIPLLAKEYISDLGKDRKNYSDYAETGEFFVSKFIGAVREQLYAAYFDNGMHLIDCVKISEGAVNSSDVNIRDIVTGALSKDASFVVIAHNHPKGVLIPSGEDLDTTRACATALSLINVTLREHYIVSGTNYMGIIKMRSGTEGQF